jgi:tetratricopeptide (TPR) repeat protein
MHNAAAAPESCLSAQCLFDTIAKVYVLTAALYSDVLASLVQWHCGLGDLIKETIDVRSVLDEAAARPEELRKITENDADFAEWVTAHNVAGDAKFMIKEVRAWFTGELARYKLVHALNDRGELDTGKLEEVAKEFEKVAEMDRELELWRNYFSARSNALRANVLAARSWKELLERAKGFWELWRETEKHPEPTAGYLARVSFILGEYLVYLAVSGDKRGAEELLKEQRQLLDYDEAFSVVTRLMLKLLGVGEGARQVEVVETSKPWLSPEFWPALLMLAGRLQKDKTLEVCAKISNAQPPVAERCNIIVAAATGNRIAAEMLRSVLRSAIESEASEARPLLGKADGRTLVEVLAPIYSQARVVFMLLAAVEGRADAVRLHGLLGSAAYKGTVFGPLFRAVYENCGDLNSEGCRLALLKLYYLHF